MWGLREALHCSGDSREPLHGGGASARPLAAAGTHTRPCIAMGPRLLRTCHYVDVRVRAMSVDRRDEKFRLVV